MAATATKPEHSSGPCGAACGGYDGPDCHSVTIDETGYLRPACHASQDIVGQQAAPKEPGQQSVDLGVREEIQRILSVVPASEDLNFITDSRQDSPQRPLNWRIRRAARYWHANGRSRRCDDTSSRTALQFIRAANRVHTEAQLERFHDANLGVYNAFSLAADNDLRTREVEARILSRQAYAAIEEWFCFPEGTVEAFESLFFNVADRLQYPSWIVQHVLGEKWHDGLSPEGIETIWKAHAYFGGSHVLTSLICPFPMDAKPQDAAGVHRYFARAAMERLRVQAIVALQTLDTSNPKVATRLLRVLMRMQASEKKRAQQKCDERALGLGIKATLKCISGDLPDGMYGMTDDFSRKYERQSTIEPAVSTTDNRRSPSGIDSKHHPPRVEKCDVGA